MSTPLPPPTVILPALISTEFDPPGTPGPNGFIMPPGVYLHTPPFNYNRGTAFIFQSNSMIVPGSTLTVEAECFMSANGQPILPQPIISFAAVPLLNGTATKFFLPYQDNGKNIKGFSIDPVYDIYGTVKDAAGNPYGFLRSIYACWNF
ncbi:hypothetical protein [Pseudomonas trivialis]|uniref:hypothetical protein n=1 Tax=Pseudomonas trivialis TaxID=200450 RepID=UPI001112D3F8|nr:hypothetical protein [Pseudomonas trivialis]